MIHVHEDLDWVEESGEWIRACACGYSPDRPAWRVLVTGSRSWPDKFAVWRMLNEQARYAEAHDLPVVVVEGQCPHGGADHFAEQWAKAAQARGLPVHHDPVPANWVALGKRAGPFRNQVMVDRGADICLAFPTQESRGTWDCVRRAEAAGIPVKVLDSTEALTQAQQWLIDHEADREVWEPGELGI